MKLGFGLYYHMLNDLHFKFAKQCGATHIVVHLTDYFHQGSYNSSENQPIGNNMGWGKGGSNPHVWEYDYLINLKKQLEAHGLILEAIENFDPVDWYAILLDLPEKSTQIERLKQIIRNVGKAKIPIIGYNFSLAGVCSRLEKNNARGGANTVCMEKTDESPIPYGMIWNMRYDESLLHTGFQPTATHNELWQRLEWFLDMLVPIAEENNVRLAAHPDDPPAEYVRTQARLVYKPQLYQKLLDIVPSYANALEFCLGSLQEMPNMMDKDSIVRDIYYWIEHYVAQNAIGYIHFRNIRGKVPQYEETFIDEGDIDMKKVIEILRSNNYDGVLIPDHTPQMSCDAPWHAGMAYAMGYMKSLLH